MGAKRKLARRAVKRTYGSRRSSSCAPTAIAKDILAAPIGRSSSRQEAATAKRGGAGGEPHNGASLRSRRAAPGRQNTRTPDHGSRASSSVRSPSGGFSTSRWNGAHNVGSGFSCGRTAFGRRPRRVYPHAAARALRRPWIGMTAKVAGSPAGRATAVVRFNARRGMSADAAAACIRRAPGRLARCALWRRLRHFRPLGLHAASERVHQVDDVLR